ncbi:MAG TPA: spherulation-specific family 4 protein [Kineosporiaceae bacterium]
MLVSPAAATELPLSRASLITNNLQGAGSDDAGSKWTTSVQRFMRYTDVAMLQEVGPGGPPDAVQVPTAPAPGVQEYHWTPDSVDRGPGWYNVYFTQTDTNPNPNTAGRVNIAIVTVHEPDEVRTFANPTQRGRVALGVRFGTHWYITFHGLSGGGGDSAAMLDAIDDAINPGSSVTNTWTVGADFNVAPETIVNRTGWPPNARTVASGRATHIGGGELDYFVTNDLSDRSLTASRQDGATPDHAAVRMNSLRAGAEPPPLTIRPYVPAPETPSGPNSTSALTTFGLGLLALFAWISKRDVPAYTFVGSHTLGGGLAYEPYSDGKNTNPEQGGGTGSPPGGGGTGGPPSGGTSSPPGGGGTGSGQGGDVSPRQQPTTADSSNIVLLQPGVDEVKAANYAPGAGPGDMAARIDQIQLADPAKVVVAALVPPTAASVTRQVGPFNDRVRTLVTNLRNAGRHVVLADMSRVTDADLKSDGVTLTPAGIDKMAAAYQEAVVDALFAGWIHEPSSSTPSRFGQQIAVAAYTHPKADRAAWDRMIGADSHKMSVLVANVLNGPGSQRVDEWGAVIDRAHVSGKKVIGYVDTGYLGLADNRRTRLGSPAAEDWIAQIEQDINAWYRLYGSSIDGIFFDDGYNECGANNAVPRNYQEINNYVKRHHPGGLTVLNPGTVVPECYKDSADVLLTYEGSYDGYLGRASNPALNYQGLSWTPTSPSKIWHIIYGVPSSGITQVAQTAKDRGAGYVEITDDVMPNPYDQQPGADYLAAEQGAVAGGTPPAAPPTPYTSRGREVAANTGPGGRLLGSDYTSATIAWSSATGAARYVVSVNDQAVATLPASMLQTTIGGLDPGGKTYRIDVTAQDADGNNSAPGGGISVTTLSLPGGKPVTNVKVAIGATSTTYSADFLVPYSFHRVYVWGWDVASRPHPDNPCWPVNYNGGGYVCTDALVENSTYLTYAGTSSTAPAWSWNPIAYTPPTVDGYTYTWTVPAGHANSSLHLDQFVIQGEGYAPLTNVFSPCPTYNGGPDNSLRDYCAG